MSDEILERTKIKSLIQNYGTQKNRHCVSRILGLCCAVSSRAGCDVVVQLWSVNVMELVLS